MSLEDRLRGAAADHTKGITLWRTTTGGWQAAMTIDGTGWVVETRDDPADAMNALLGRHRSLDGGLGGIALARTRLTTTWRALWRATR